MTKKSNWADTDKRIRARHEVWTTQEKTALDEALKKLPDLAAQMSYVELAQPALSGSTDATPDDAN
ncbi:MAG: hypothetical protein EXR75_11705 [Myxococcales bacterium]|nr:hypothetical protein [Myxococcales bacterium]